jgi:dolichol-phosphate mannosyltransferase
MAQFAVGGILSSSTFLLRLSAFIGAVLVLLNAFAVFFEITNSVNKAFEVIVILDLMYLVFFMATISIYIARIYKNGVQRPVFIVDKRYTLINASPLDEE